MTDAEKLILLKMKLEAMMEIWEVEAAGAADMEYSVGLNYCWRDLRRILDSV